MAYSQLAFNDFPGLDLVSAPDEAGCIDLLNVDFAPGAVRSRDGYDNMTSAEGANRYDSLFPVYFTGGTKYLLAGAGNRLEALTTAGGVGSSSTAPTASPHFFARFGTPSTEYVYCANGTDQLRRFDGTNFTAPAALAAQTGKFVAVQSTDNRLVNARFPATKSRVQFSNPGLAETWGANDYVDLTPGDGQDIMGVVAWRDLLFVFKESRFFVFYGNSTDSAGNPVFNYRPVDAGVGLAATRALVAAPDGVYFLSRRGVHRTTGGEPELLSGPLDPLFLEYPFSAQPLFYEGSAVNSGSIDKAAMAWMNDRLYVSVPTGTATVNDRMLVHSTARGWWTVWDIKAAALAAFRVGNQALLTFAYASGLKHVGRHPFDNAGVTYIGNDGTGAGTSIVSRYRTGFTNFGSDNEKRIVKTRLFGLSGMDLQWSTDFGDLGAKVNVSGLTSLGHAVVSSNAAKGRLFSWQLSADDGGFGAAWQPWHIFRVLHEVDPQSPPDTST